jgi:hypothetical protein
VRGRFQKGNTFSQVPACVATRFQPGNHASKPGPSNAYWRNGVTFVLQDGRWRVSFPFLWRRCLKAKRSRVVWQVAHRMSLPRWLHVHHIGAKDDDRPENLMLMTRAEHVRWHRWEGPP